MLQGSIGNNESVFPKCRNPNITHPFDMWHFQRSRGNGLSYAREISVSESVSVSEINPKCVTRPHQSSFSKSLLKFLDALYKSLEKLEFMLGSSANGSVLCRWQWSKTGSKSTEGGRVWLLYFWISCSLLCGGGGLYCCWLDAGCIVSCFNPFTFRPLEVTVRCVKVMRGKASDGPDRPSNRSVLKWFGMEWDILKGLINSISEFSGGRLWPYRNLVI